LTGKREAMKEKEVEERDRDAGRRLVEQKVAVRPGSTVLYLITFSFPWFLVIGHEEARISSIEPVGTGGSWGGYIRT
jgi:hypothetical protein